MECSGEYLLFLTFHSLSQNKHPLSSTNCSSYTPCGSKKLSIIRHSPMTKGMGTQVGLANHINLFHGYRDEHMTLFRPISILPCYFVE